MRSASALHLFGQVAVRREVRPARRPDLNEVEPPFQFRVLVQQAVDRAQPLGDALRVIDPVHPHDQRPVAEPVLLAERRGTGLPVGAEVLVRQCRIDADRERADGVSCPPRWTANRSRSMRHSSGPVHGLQEVVAVVLGVEPEQVVAEHPVEQFVGPRADAERLRVGPRDVPELRHHQVRPRGLQQPRQEGEVVVLDEDERRAALRFLKHGRGERLVHPAVGVPVGRVERPGARTPGGTAATACCWRTRSSTPPPRPW